MNLASQRNIDAWNFVKERWRLLPFWAKMYMESIHESRERAQAIAVNRILSKTNASLPK